MPAIVVVGESQEDQPKDGCRISAGLEVGVGTQIVGGAPEISFKVV
jgi:hypothetical protein